MSDIDWSKAPDWATMIGILGADAHKVWANDYKYSYYDKNPNLIYTFGIGGYPLKQFKPIEYRSVEPVTGNKYHRQITGICGKRATIDVYRVLHAFPTGLPEIDHAVKKLLAPGMRGAKDRITDLREAAQSIECAIKYLEQVNDR